MPHPSVRENVFLCYLVLPLPELLLRGLLELRPLPPLELRLLPLELRLLPLELLRDLEEPLLYDPELRVELDLLLDEREDGLYEEPLPLDEDFLTLVPDDVVARLLEPDDVVVRVLLLYVG